MLVYLYMVYSYMRQREFKDIKLCMVKIILIAMCLYLETLIFQCQTNPEIHCSPAMPHVQDKTKYLLYKSYKSNENLLFLAHLWSRFS